VKISRHPKRLTVELAEVQLRIIDLESFKANKRASACPKDLADLSELSGKILRINFPLKPLTPERQY